MKIGIFSSSSPASPDAMNRSRNAINFLQSKGHEVVLGKLFNQKDNYRSGTIKERANEFNELLKDNCDIYLSSIGGFCSNSVIKLIDLNLISEKMIFIGNSDASPILNFISHKTKAKVIYGPALISTFGEWETDFSEISYNKMMEAIINKVEVDKFEFWTDEYSNWDKFDKPKQRYKNQIVFKGQKIISGNLIGGNLNSLTTTTFFSEKERFQNSILFIEDSHKSLDQIEKLLASLFVNGIIPKITGIIFGKYEQIVKSEKATLPHEIFNELLEAYEIKSIPMVYYIDCGHTHPTNSLILNKTIYIDFENEKIWQ